MEIRQQLVASRSKTYGEGNPVDFITIHETANSSIGAGAQAHANLQSKGNVRDASWHWQVDDKVAIQSFPHTVRCWHAGDGRGTGNLSSIGIEICVNADGDFRKAVENAATLVRTIMAEEGIPLERVVQHSRWSGKNCPTFLRNGSRGITWNDFLNLVKGVVTPPAKPPVAPPKKENLMAELPVLDWRKQNTAYDAMTERVQGLLAAADCYTDRLDGRRGPKSLAALRTFQIRSNSGDGRGGADMFIGPRTWESLLLGKRW